ncbi:MAG: OmpA family protein [Saprospiraceae bacterium]
MTALLAIICVVLIAVIAVQVGKVTELAGKIRGEEEMQQQTNRMNGSLSMIFMVVFLIATVISAFYYKNWMLGYGPHEAASIHGKSIDYLFNVTLFFTGIVFIITHILLFYFAWKYQGRKGQKALFMPHDNKLEVIWTIIPAVVMTFLVVGGLDVWNETMGDVEPGEDVIELEATGYQFAWALRYPGPDGKLGTRDYTKINGTNILGQVWTDEKNMDDQMVDEIVLPKGKKVRVRIIARDVLHNFYLPHFRVKMDAVPGMPTYFIFTPEKTTEEYREGLSKYPEYQTPDPNDPEKMLWETFNFELACAELCGKGHFSMRRLVRIVEQDEYDAWLSAQKSFYLSSIRGTDEDPYKDELLGFEIKARKDAFNAVVQKALAATSDSLKVIRLENVNFETGSSTLTPLSRYELDNLVEVMKQYANMTIEVAGHTDNTGEKESNQVLSEERAKVVYDYIVARDIAESRLNFAGYGQDRPLDSNDTDAGRANNRRTEFKILTQ